MSEVKIGIVGCASLYEQVKECIEPIEATFTFYPLIPSCIFSMKGRTIKNFLNRSITNNNITIVFSGICHPELLNILSDYGNIGVTKFIGSNCYEIFLGKEKYAEYHQKSYLMLNKPFFTKFKKRFFKVFDLGTKNGKILFQESFKKILCLKFENERLDINEIEDFAKSAGLEYEIHTVNLENLENLLEDALLSATSSIFPKLIERKIAKITKELKKSEEKYHEAYNLIKFYKDLFAHDMQNILQGIISAAEFYSLFRDDPDRLKEVGDFPELIKQQASKGSTLIKHIMALTKFNGNLGDLCSINVTAVLNKSIENVIISFQERNVNIEIDNLSKDLEIIGNNFLIEVFDNILNNAVKYNYNEEEVKINIKISKIQEEDIPYIKFEFIDYGIGVNDEKKKTLFKKDYSNDISKRGMGIGLSLVKKIINLYNGKIWAEDRIKGDYKKGSNFIILLREGKNILLS